MKIGPISGSKSFVRFCLLHPALGAELPDFIHGKESAEQALADVEAAYIAAAKEKGFLN